MTAIGLERAKILVVDDLPDRLLVFSSVLEELDQEIVTARSGWEALKLVLHQEFAVILLDVNMPGMDGFETAALIRARRRSAHVPIIFITAYADEMQTERGYSIGAVDYILTPVVPEILRSKVRVFVELFQMQQAAKRQAEERITLVEERAKRGIAEEATRRSAFLAEASRALASSLDFDACLTSLAKVMVPYLADVLLVALFDEPHAIYHAEVICHHADGQLFRTTDINEIERHTALFAEVAGHGKSRTIQPLDADLIALFEKCVGVPIDRTGAALALPLIAGGRTVGALFVAATETARAQSLDYSLAEDIAGRAAIAIDNARLYQDVREADNRKNEFLAMLAHELRNPLAPIRTALDVMQLRGGGGPELSWAQDVIDRQLTHMVRLVDDLLDVSRITRGKIRLQLECLNAQIAVTTALETSKPLIEAHNHALTLSLPSEPLYVRADPARLSQILANLLNNAAKYTPDGGTITLSLQQDGEEAVFRVQDTGIGIPKEMQNKVFDLFTQVDRSLDRSQGGLGIGLTLVRRLVELHNGSIEVTSDGAGFGSRFSVKLPLISPLTSELPESNWSIAQGVMNARKVLVVDDNVDAAGSLSMLLQLGGHEVRLAHDGPSALVQAQDFKPEVVLLDIGLPGMDGYAVARALRKDAELAHVRLIAISGYGQDDDRKKSQEAGFDFHLVKPVQLDSLSALLLDENCQEEIERGVELIQTNGTGTL